MQRRPIQFNGWKLKSGKVIRSFEIADDTVKPGEQEADQYHQATGYKGRMTPQYAR